MLISVFQINRAIQFDKEKTEMERRDKMVTDLSVLNSSAQPQIEKKVKDNNSTTISWKTFLAKTFLTLG